MRRLAAIASLLALLSVACGAGESLAPAGRIVGFTTSDGVELTGEVRGDGSVGVVLAHMFPNDRTAWSSFASSLADRGYLALTFDFRGYGDSGGTKDIPAITADVLAAVEAIREEGAVTVVLVGASMGGSASLLAAAQAEVDGVVTLSAARTFMGLNVTEQDAALIDEPKLFLAAQDDASAPDTAQLLFSASRPPKEVHIVTGGDHGTDMLTGGQAEVVRNHILTFLARFAPVS